MDTAEFLWRVGLVVAAVAAAIYFVALTVRLRRLGREPRSAVPSRHPVESPQDLVFVAAPTVEEAVRTPVFEEHLAWTHMGSEIRDLRAEVAALRDQVTALQEQVAQQGTARRVSPYYADAAELARRGFDARGVAEECGISVAEAELVLAMSSGASNFDDEVHDDRSGQGNGIESPGR